ncbi:hypothetical protein CJT60_01170 [Pseudomonas aeruginosa]|uniref:hypothetical protein n=1 Tax=Pseudomonas aeruginosa TaxID=287 RepID=UPI000BB6A167|nr:hypothetical protein [Pseudomonas aeruginosa]PBY11561.1 hypothetical protein CJT64_07665 [Pseudomonas aeruginosa]PBY30726.1 hypothetical protein CJT60_01170 [Pseudomonas aeruginosa]
MARRLVYTGAPPITLEDVARHCRVEIDDLEPELIEHVIIPGVVAQAEGRTGAAVRPAEYVEEWPERYASGHALDMGQASEILSIQRVAADGSGENLDVPRYLERGQRESFLHFPGGRPAGVLRIRYAAGMDTSAYPGVRLWLLMSAATAYEFRETLVSGTILAELPSSFIDSLLTEIEVPARF